MKALAEALLCALLVGCGSSIGAVSPPASPTRSTSTTASPVPSGTLPSGGISEAEAITRAREHASFTTFESASAGVFRDLNIDPSPAPGDPIKPNQLVWAVKFSGDMTICPPWPNTACHSPRPGIQMVYLDYFTGAYLSVRGFSPSP